MSKEFEEIVLKKLEKLDVLEQNMRDTDNVIKSDILEKLEKLNVLEQNMRDTDNVIKNEILNKLEKLDVLEKEMKDNNKRLNNFELELKDTQEIVINLNQNFVKFDHEINKKIETLFDAYSINSEKNMLNQDRINSINSKILNHDIRISNLESKIITA